jgi:hypothetical protein
MKHVGLRSGQEALSLVSQLWFVRVREWLYFQKIWKCPLSPELVKGFTALFVKVVQSCPYRKPGAFVPNSV